MNTVLPVFPKRVDLGANFYIECRKVTPKQFNKPKYYEFSICPKVGRGRKYRTYRTLAFPGCVKISFVEVK